MTIPKGRGRAIVNSNGYDFSETAPRREPGDSMIITAV
jgi:hypothetical protein